MPDLWDTDDQMPSCDNCMGGLHASCLDIMYSNRYGEFACGCSHPFHDVASV